MFGSAHFYKYLVSGLINTTITYFIYLALLAVFPYIVAYSITYIIGIILGFILSSKWVFMTKINAKIIIAYPIAYMFSYLISCMLLWIFVEKLRFSKQFSPLIILVITVPLMFILTKLIFKKSISHDAPISIN